ncbi:hypothetical protein NST74_28825 [Paenibacillus sp. FSL F4-0125]|uniref:leucine-rich repeat domain-containing protein n=1 Tax=Paenibacillus sp. FSL F4-0125 TaxID=2954730 RepID=UPI0030F8463F
MYNNHIKEIPDQPFLHDELEVLNYAGNEIERLSDNISRLVHLRMLDLGHNRLKVLPESIGGLQGLDSFLYLSNNQFQQLPEQLCNLQKLKYLNVTDNHLKQLPVRKAK